MIRTSFVAASSLLALVVACSSSSSSGTEGPPLSDATSLDCPSPGQLPFRLDSYGFANQDNAELAPDNPRNKDEASDALGNENGPASNVYVDVGATPTTGIPDFKGRKARTSNNGGIAAKAYPGEFVSLWAYDDGAKKWNSLGRQQTDDNGYYDIPATATFGLGVPVYAVLEADQTCAKHYDTFLPPGTKVVVTDIDGTLTTSDAELFTENGDVTYEPATKTDAVGAMSEWAKKKYVVIYLSARTHLFRADTRQWLEKLAFPVGPVLTAQNLLTDDDSTTAYKLAWMKRMVTSFGWTIEAAYGNALTDIAAYQQAGVTNDKIFIIGPNAGANGSTAIAGDDYTSHVSGYIDAQPDNTP